jgi:hypothetical protein
VLLYHNSGMVNIFSYPQTRLMLNTLTRRQDN